MKQLSILFLSLFCMLIAACSDDDKEQEPILVTNVVVTDADKVFKPGETITITAQGFREGDQFIVDMRWPLDEPSGPIKEGSSVSNPIDLKRTGNSVSFIVPGHCPAATLKLLLIRSDKTMPLCNVSVASGQGPKELQLYGITNSRSMAEYPHGIEHIDLTTVEITKVTQFLEGEDFSLALNIPGSWALTGRLEKSGEYTLANYDLSTNSWSNTSGGQLITLCQSTNQLYSIYQKDENTLAINSFTPTIYTRLNNQIPSPSAPTCKLPEGMKAKALSSNKGIQMTANQLLFSADNGDGTFSPTIMRFVNGEFKMETFAPIQADNLIPFWVVLPKEEANNKMSYSRVCGFAVVSKSKPNGTELRLWNTDSNTLEAPFATYPNAARSIATHFTEDLKSQELYLLTEGRDGAGMIHIYDLQKKEWRMFSFGFPYSEIVFAR